MTRIDFDKYEGFYAKRTGGLRSSVMRDLMAVVARPDVITLAGGLPNTESFPARTLARVTHEVSMHSSAAALQYGPTDGFEETKRNIVKVMAEENTVIDPEDVIVTTGGQQGIDLVTRIFVDPGDTIIAGRPLIRAPSPRSAVSRRMLFRCHSIATESAPTCSRARSTGSGKRAPSPSSFTSSPIFITRPGCASAWNGGWRSWNWPDSTN